MFQMDRLIRGKKSKLLTWIGICLAIIGIGLAISSYLSPAPKKPTPIAELTNLAADVFEDRPEARRWMDSPLHALGGRTPRDLCRTKTGAEQVRQLLGRIEHGVFS
jgi:Antitoxin Xre/MbcA/ParS C-terminal toxin-binding domain